MGKIKDLLDALGMVSSSTPMREVERLVGALEHEALRLEAENEQLKAENEKLKAGR